MHLIKKIILKTSAIKRCPALIVLLFLSWFNIFAQSDTTVNLTFDFNDQQIKEKNDKISAADIKAVGVSLTYDRFGNERSALYVHGHNASYLSLGTSNLFKNPNMTISMWVNLDRRVYAGKGFESNALYSLSNSPNDDFSNAHAIGYLTTINRFGANSTKDSTMEVDMMTDNNIKFNRWYHLVVICNNHFFAFYLDGALQGKSVKTFETRFDPKDSVVIGHSASKKNERYAQAMFDDIRIFHRSLTDKEVLDLYYAPNPNETKNLLRELLKYGIIVLGFALITIIILVRNKRALKKKKAELELLKRISELELKVVKAQINPHFISNCLAAIQDLVYANNNEKAGVYIAKFSFFVRQVLNYSDENYITLEQELELIKLFVELEQLRFKDGFTFEFIADESIDYEDLLIPSLVTQPFVENAIWHGLLPLGNLRAPRLIIRILVRNGSPVIEIEDNGVGRSANPPVKNRSKGTQLVMDKIDSLNTLSETSNYKVEIVDIVDAANNKQGTRIVIHLEYIKE